jgi:hypothetical protein
VAWRPHSFAIQENEHIILLENMPFKPSNSSIYIYSTSALFHDNLLFSVHHVWNESGAGGDKCKGCSLGDNFGLERRGNIVTRLTLEEFFLKSAADYL